MKQIIIRPDGRKKVVTINNEPTRAQLQFKDDCDVNNIMAKFKRTGSITHLRNASTGVYADLTQIPDYMSALTQIQKAQKAFESVPAELRARFSNDPAKFIEYLKDPKNREEAETLGLLKPKPGPPHPATPKDDKPATPPPSTPKA